MSRHELREFERGVIQSPNKPQGCRGLMTGVS